MTRSLDLINNRTQGPLEILRALVQGAIDLNPLNVWNHVTIVGDESFVTGQKQGLMLLFLAHESLLQYCVSYIGSIAPACILAEAKSGGRVYIHPQINLTERAALLYHEACHCETMAKNPQYVAAPTPDQLEADEVRAVRGERQAVLHLIALYRDLGLGEAVQVANVRLGKIDMYLQRPKSWCDLDGAGACSQEELSAVGVENTAMNSEGASQCKATFQPFDSPFAPGAGNDPLG